MPRIAGVATALPPNVLKQEDIKSFANAVFGSAIDVERLLPVFDNALIEERHFVSDFDWFNSAHDFTQVNDSYIKSALALAKQVTLAVSDSSSIATTEFDAVFFISTTGLSTPSIDALLFNEIPFNPHIKRIPIWGLGCAGGAAGFARAYDYALAYPKSKVLVISVELCGLAFQANDHSKSNVIATALFGDGAAATVVVGDEVRSNGANFPKILGTLSTTYPGTLDVMGWKVTSNGFKVVLSKDIPSIVETLVRENVEELLDSHKLAVNDIKHFLPHPGGKKVLDALQSVLGLKESDISYVYDVLRRCGNMSSATVFFILEEFMKVREPKRGEYGLLSALGPGFSSELVLLQW